MKKYYIVMFFVLCCINFPIRADWSIDVTVAKDGSGNYLSIQDAIANAPGNSSDNYVIFIKNGVYDEKLFIEKNNITLLGEDRDSTIITQAILRRIWVEENSTDWGVATINIADAVTDLTLANLTVRNNFADFNPDIANNHDHTMAIRGGGNRIIIVNCNITATGGDTLSLWNTNGGMFYHSGCFFDGYVDYVCPRGYCYISNSDFYGYNNNASIWHDGSGGKDHKLVVKNSYFSGIKDFGLGRFHRMSAFYLLDCDFSKDVRNNGGILYVGDSSAQDRDKLVYGVRVYYNRCNRETGDYDWHQDNLSKAENSPSPNEITDSWTFMGIWNPEKELKGLLPCAFLPAPGYHEKEVNVSTSLNWLSGKDAVGHLVYFGKSENPPYLASTTDTSFNPGQLDGTTRYFWHVDEVTSNDTIIGKLWEFSTEIDSLPKKAINPYPGNDSNYFMYTVAFQWEANPMEVDSFYFYFGKEDNLQLLSVQKQSSYSLRGLPKDSVYYWRVDSKNKFGLTQGTTWHFHYEPSPITSNLDSRNQTEFLIYPNPVTTNLTIEYILKTDGIVSIQLFDLQGKELMFINQGFKNVGKHLTEINLHDISQKLIPGYYLLGIKANNQMQYNQLLYQ